MTQAPTSSTSWHFHFFCQSASRASASWNHFESLTHTHRGQSIFGWICYILKTLHSSTHMPKPYLFCSSQRLVLTSCSTVRDLAVRGSATIVAKLLRVQQTILNVAIKHATAQFSNTDFFGEKYVNSPSFLNLFFSFEVHTITFIENY